MEAAHKFSNKTVNIAFIQRLVIFIRSGVGCNGISR